MKTLHNLTTLIVIAWLLMVVDSVYANQKTTLYYVSSSLGDDSNPGTLVSPKRTIRSITEINKSNLVIRLKCGDTFYESIRELSNTTITSYGDGERPILCGFKVLVDTVAWTYAGDSIWKLDMSNEKLFKGFQRSSATDKDRMNDIGCIYDITNDKIYGHLVNKKDLLKNDGDLFTSDHHKLEEITSNTFDYLYLRYHSNPNTIGPLAFSIYESGVFLLQNCTIRNIAIVGFGRCGICNLRNCIIDNCVLDIIGGSIQIGYKYWVRHGNGIELYDTSFNDSIINNNISRTYDCGVTIQALGNIRNPKNIFFRNNKLYHCRQAFEHFMNPSDTLRNPQYINCDFSYNICYEMGENEFSTPQIRDANILNHERFSRPITIKNNIFYGAPYHCGYKFADGIANNLVYIWKGQYLNHYHAIRNYPTIYANKASDIENYRKRTGDNSDIIILERGSKKDIRIARKLYNQIGWRKVNISF